MNYVVAKFTLTKYDAAATVTEIAGPLQIIYENDERLLTNICAVYNFGIKFE